MTFAYYAPFLNPTGYGLAAHMDALALSQVGTAFECLPIAACDPDASVHGRSDDVVRRHLTRAPHGKRRLVRYPPMVLPVAPGLDIAWAPFYETERWPVEHVLTMNTQGRSVIVPNEWQACAARASGIEIPVQVVPCAYDWTDLTGTLPASDPDAASRGAMGASWPVEHAITWDGAFHARKHLLGAVEAFWLAFEPGEALLDIHCSIYHPSHNALLRQSLWELGERVGRERGGGQLASVVWSTARETFKEIRSRYAKADAYLTLSRAEGVGYGALIAAGFGLPVVASDCPGHRATVPHALWVSTKSQRAGECWGSDPVTQSGMKIAGLNEDDHWHEADLESAVEQLRASVKPEARAQARSRAGELLRVHGLRPVGDRLTAVMEGV